MIDQEKCEIEEIMIEFQWRKLLCAYEYDGIEAEDENQKMRTGKKISSFARGMFLCGAALGVVVRQHNCGWAFLS